LVKHSVGELKEKQKRNRHKKCERYQRYKRKCYKGRILWRQWKIIHGSMYARLERETQDWK